MRGKKLGFVFQSYHLIPTLTALENVMLPMEFNGADGDGAPDVRDISSKVSGWQTVQGTIQFSFPEASSSASPWLEHS